MYYVYFVLDPRTNRFEKGGYSLPHEPFYVGKGTGKRHKKLSCRNKTYLAKIEELETDALNPGFVLIPDLDEETALDIEKLFIKIIGRQITNEGPLVNIHVGGKGSFAHINKNPNYKNSMQGRKHSEETKQKISEAHKGKLVGDKNPAKSIEARRKISSKLLGHPVSLETREKLRIAATLQNKKKKDEANSRI